jgi:hypothetical protein
MLESADFSEERRLETKTGKETEKRNRDVERANRRTAG